jgi:hypothetical protein
MTTEVATSGSIKRAILILQGIKPNVTDLQAAGVQVAIDVLSQSREQGAGRVTAEDVRDGAGALIKVLMSFYDVKSIEELISAQAQHVERLQAKLPPSKEQAISGRVRG